jgi:hypothetical protein
VRDEAISTDRALGGPRLLRSANKKKATFSTWDTAILQHFHPGRVGRPAGAKLAMTIGVIGST